MGLFDTSGLDRKKKRNFQTECSSDELTLGADFRAALVANCLRGALPPVDFRAVCFVRAMREE